MRPCNPPSAEATLRYRQPPPSGNAINGHGERSWRPAAKVFHRVPYGDPDQEPAAWKALDFHFNMISSIGAPLFGLGILRHVLWNRWQLRRANGPVAPQRQQADPATMAERVRRFIQDRYPAALVGFSRVGPDAVYQDERAPYPTAVCIGLPMRRDDMVFAPQPRADMEVLRAYREIARVAIETGEFIRGLGWPAKAYGDTKSTAIMHIPLALAAGLGQLGKHGSMISHDYGSNFRLATVLTELPLEYDQPVDIGVDDLCLGCRRCLIDCPPQAIHMAKQWVRGVEKWYVDFDKCVHYFAETAGCGICIEVCPWSEPGRGPELSRKLLGKRGRGRGGG